ncbi:hypothetical protein VVD49_06415 [Uliginosibacterium sp. H3]|uniref:Uncharacterized protein n=1 Tax=Uliginosibacterium silvisoli TaxID=3114758 RepID=A0ABU6K184_9RHOO|nr:hypothetical protein [Uliginosibacterium sp. H3]
MATNLTQGAARAQIHAEDVVALRNHGVLVQDPRRERPRYFDGRFLAARDLIRDQQYFLTREADLGRAAGSGVAHGLFVDQGATPHALHVTAGQGITPAGELVLIPHQLTINLADIPVADQLSARFGLSRIPTPPLRSRTGLYILALRPVEFTANPVGAYPTSLTGPRTVEDGDVIEATALVLVPWQDDGAADALEARRGRAARTIFTQSTKSLASANVLPIAMLALQSNTIVWIDEAMVRRELGADRGDLPGLGFAPRALRLAHLLQHQTHLADVVTQMHGRSFPASTQFPALPPAGPLPVGIIDTKDFTQRYFPAEVDVDFSIIPEDELPALIEEALALPPIDFLASEAALDLTAVLVLAPVPRSDYRAVMAKLVSRTRTLKPAAPNLIAQRKPLEILQRMRLPLPIAVPDVSNPADAEWARLAKLPTLWFVRRRNLAYRDDLVGNGVAATGSDEIALENAVKARVLSLGLKPQFDSVMAKATSKASWSVLSLLALPRFTESPALTAAALGALAAKAAAAPSGRLDNADALSVGVDMKTAGVGDGIVLLEKSISAGVSKSALVNLASNDAWKKLDVTAIKATTQEVTKLSARLAPTGKAATEVVTPVTGTAEVTKPATKIGGATVTDSVKIPVTRVPVTRVPVGKASDTLVVAPVKAPARSSVKAPASASAKTPAAAPTKAPAKASAKAAATTTAGKTPAAKKPIKAATKKVSK